MYSDILILNRLAQGPAHGYEIKKRVELATGQAINNNTLYPALRRFEQQGAIERVAAETDPGRPPRTIYAITDTGRDQLHALLHDTDPAVLADHAEFEIRVAYFELIDVGTRRAIIAARRQAVERMVDLHQKAFMGTGRAWARRVVDHNLKAYRLELTWLDELADAAEEPPDG
ncbi:PadR family transcriptional regulator [Planotetraspora mira]|uniref:PadR family transcriptional regulator n=1 Tax=Planotetraspora mira TaxID=58121 RepID=A0A8J3TK44_9ACTN|nr:PadR family transcriptional regulator [Planotetraspora mira]GII27181.1 PadR family transcriptional regulator [Planotetraspora mira]